MNPFPFFVGRGRSGTTLVRAIFNAHPEMAVPNESHFILPLARRRRRYEVSQGFEVDPFIADLAETGFVDMGLSWEALHSALIARPPADYPDAVRFIFSLCAEREGKTRYADKTPIHVLSLPALASLFPEARFVHIIRDGRDVALSYLNVPWGPRTLPEAAFLWKRAVQRGRRAGARLGIDRYREIRYEELVDNPEVVIRELCPFVGLTFVPEMLRYFEHAGRVTGGMRHPETRQGLYLPPTKGLRDWREEMPSHDVALFEALAGDVLSDLGYERAHRHVPVGTRFEATFARAGIQTARLQGKASKLSARVVSARRR